MENKQERRKHIRIPIISEAVSYETIPETDGTPITQEYCELKDLSQGGCFIKTTYNLKPKSFITVSFSLPGDMGLFNIKGKIVRRKWALKKDEEFGTLGIGVEFVDVPVSSQKILDAYCIYLRNKQIITVSKRIIEEFIGPKGPQI